MGEVVKLNQMLDDQYSAEALEGFLDEGVDVNAIDPSTGEAPIHVAARRRRLEAVARLLDAGATIDLPNRHGKSAWAHSVRRGFTEIAELLEARGASTTLAPADQFAVAITRHQFDRADEILASEPGVARTGNPEEDRLLADMAGRLSTEPVAFLLKLDVDLQARALDDGTPLHQAAWFGSPDNARLLVEAGADLDAWEECHGMTPLGWAVHGSRYSGDAENRQEAYLPIVRLLLDAGSTLHHPAGSPATISYLERLRGCASPAVLELLPDVAGD